MDQSDFKQSTDPSRDFLSDVVRLLVVLRSAPKKKEKETKKKRNKPMKSRGRTIDF